MEAIAVVLIAVAAAVWVGAIVFQSAVVAPAVFVDLDEAAARGVLRTLFPRFFMLGLICGLIMAVGASWLVVQGIWNESLMAVSLATIVMLVLEAASLWMVPSINAARDAGAAGQARFGTLHRASVMMTVVILLLGIGVLTLIGAGAAAGLGA